MEQPPISMAQQIARAASAFQQDRTGRLPSAVSVVLSGQTLVVTLHGTLSLAERALTETPDGAAKIQEFHKQLFLASADPLRQDIKRITGVDVCESSVGLADAAGTVAQVFTTGAMVQVFLLAGKVSTETWSGDGHGNQRCLVTGEPVSDLIRVPVKQVAWFVARNFIHGEIIMLWTIFVILLVLWALGLASGATMGGFIHLLLVIAVVVVLIRIIQGRHPL